MGLPKPLGLLLDIIYDNTGDKAARVVMEKFFQRRSAADEALLKPAIPGVEVVPCVGLLTEPAHADFKIKPGTLGFNFAPATALPRPEIDHLLAKLTDWKKLFNPFTHYNGDRKVMAPLEDATADTYMAPYLQPEELFGLIGQLDCLVASSLHACLFAYASNVPFVAIDRSHVTLGEQRDRAPNPGRVAERRSRSHAPDTG